MPKTLRLCTLPLLSTLLACGSSGYDIASEPTLITNDRPENENDLRKAIDEATVLPLPEEVSEREVSARNGPRVTGSTSETCVYRRYQGVKHFESLATFNPNADSIWPGAVVQSVDLPRGLARPIPLARRPARIAISNVNIEGSGAQYFVDVEKPALGSVTQAVDTMLKSGKVTSTAKINTSIAQVYSMEHLAASFGFDVSAVGSSMSALFKTDMTSKRTNLVVRVTQEYFTVSMEAPAAPELVFAPEVTGQAARPFMGPNNPPVFLSSVTYGRVLYLAVQSEREASEVSAALEFTLGKKIEGESEVDVASVLEKTTLQAFSMGGDPEAAARINLATASDYRDLLKEYLTKGATFSATSPGAAIAYNGRRLVDGQLVKLASTLDYEIPYCDGELNAERFDVKEAVVEKDGKKEGENDVHIVLEYQPAGAAADAWSPLAKSNTLRGHNRHAEDLETNVYLLKDVRRASGSSVKIRMRVVGKDTCTAEKQHTWLTDPLTGAGSWTGFEAAGATTLRCANRSDLFSEGAAGRVTYTLLGS